MNPPLQWLRVCALLAATLATSRPAPAVELLPDLIPWEYGTHGFELVPSFDTTTIANRVLYRFPVRIPNIGDGPLEVREVTDGTTSQTVYQRIYTTEGEVNEQLIGMFSDPAPDYSRGFHLWLVGLAQYNLYEAVPDGGGQPLVGPLVSRQDKISMGIVDSGQYPPVASAPRTYTDVADELLGISIGWADFYSRQLPGQWVDVTGLADGQYWLEVSIDPYQFVEELDDTNNTTRLLITLDIPDPEIHPGDYNDNGLVDAADYTLWRDTLGSAIDRGTGADGDGDGMVDAQDYTVWRQHFGQVAAGEAGSIAPVPEPASAAMLAGLLLAWKWRWPRVSRRVILAAGFPPRPSAAMRPPGAECLPSR